METEKIVARILVTKFKEIGTKARPILKFYMHG